MALPDPSGGPEDREEQSRRFALLKTYLSAFLIAGLVGVPGWLHSPSPAIFGLSATLVPTAVSSCLLIALCVSVPALYPASKLTPLLALTSAAMHVIVTMAFATVLTVRPNALMGLPEQMEPLARWDTLPLACSAFVAETAVLVIYAVVFSRLRHPSPPPGGE